MGNLDRKEADVQEDPVGMRAGRMGRGEDEGVDVGGVVEGVIAPAQRESGLQESLRRQLWRWLGDRELAGWLGVKFRLTLHCSRE